MHPLVSILIPHFNRARLIRETVDSVLAQTVCSWELIIIDDGSDVEQREVLEHFEDSRVLIMDRKGDIKGPSACRNLGARSARAEFVLFLDSDDLLAPNCLEDRLKAAANEPNFDLWVFPTANFEKYPGDLGTLWGTMIPGGDDAARFASGDAPWHTSSPLWRTKGFLALGGFNERVFYGDDADIHLRAVVLGLKICQFPNSPPDTFVRRSTEPRITNSLSDALIDSRRIRLREGTRFLRDHIQTTRLWPIWEGQYFVEAEFLLFNCRGARPSINHVFDAWTTDWQPAFLQRILVKIYIEAVQGCLDRAYCVVRLARQIAMVLLPREFFSSYSPRNRAAPECRR